MNSRPTCRCLLCQIEKQLISQVTSATPEYEVLLGSIANGLDTFASPFLLLAHLKATHADPSSDDLYRELLAARVASPELVETLMIVAFVPLLHGIVRRIARQQLHLARADITQQTLIVFLQVLRSEHIEKRQSHFAFAISRLVKRRLFDWAAREGAAHGPRKKDELQVAAPLTDDESVERHALLGHFLNRCVANSLLSDAELDLLVQIKLDGNTGDEIAESNSITSNAVRQRMKRLLAKLRRTAGNGRDFRLEACDTFSRAGAERIDRGEFTPKRPRGKQEHGRRSN